VLESPDMSTEKNIAAQLYLASSSPRRRELLSLGGWEYALLPVQVDETPLPGEDGVEYVQRLAKRKAYTASCKADITGVIIAADTAVIDREMSGNTKIFGKPHEQNEASEMLQSLRGHTHQVHTAISILRTSDGTLNGPFISDLCTTDVPMRNYSDVEIATYIASGDPMDKAGAYAIQHNGFHPVEKLEGCFANVMGLPLCHLTRSLIKIGIPPIVDIPQACQAALGYDCTVYPNILKEKTQDYACG
jgi:septum formation protein